jgi:tetratricopeptide (TPR) repeat protein
MRSALYNKRIATLLVVLVLAVAAHVPAVCAAEYINPVIGGKESPAYWLDRAGLLSTYGNYPAAVNAYRKSLAIDPGAREAYFGLGVALGAMGDFDGALENIDRAIALTPDNDRYHYGRGWVMMISGQFDKALSDLQKADALGNPDARAYLQHLKSAK